MSSGVGTESRPETCVLIMVAGTDLEAGEYTIKDQWGSTEELIAGVAITVGGKKDLESVTLLEAGKVVIRQTEGKWSGEVDGQAVVLQLPSRKVSKHYEGVAVSLSFDIEVPPSPTSTAEGI